MSKRKTKRRLPLTPGEKFDLLSAVAFDLASAGLPVARILHLSDEEAVLLTLPEMEGRAGQPDETDPDD